MMFMLLFDIVIVGAVVSFSGVGGVGSTGVTGVGGVGSTGSSPPQDTAMDTLAKIARKRANRFPVRPGMTVGWLDQCIYPRSFMDYPAWETWEMGIRKRAPSERTAFLCLSPDDSRADLPEYPYPA